MYLKWQEKKNGRKMKNTIVIILCLLSALLNSCQYLKDIEGVYYAKKSVNKFEFFSDSTFIYQSFIYYGSHFENKYSDGTWKRVNNNVILNSRIKNNLIPVSVEKSESDTFQICTNLIITQTKCKDPNYEYIDTDYYVIPYINGNNYLDLHPELSDEPVTITARQLIMLPPDPDKPDYIINIPPVKRGNYCLLFAEPVDSICFEIKKDGRFKFRFRFRTYYHLKTEKVNIPAQSDGAITINIALNDSLFSYRIFDNTVLKIKGKKLIFKDKENRNNKTNKLIRKITDK